MILIVVYELWINSKYFSGRTGEDGQPCCCLIRYHACVGFWVNKIVNKLVLKLNCGRWWLSWLLQIHDGNCSFCS